MNAISHNEKFAKQAGVPQSVGKEFNEADQMKKRKFKDGGAVQADVRKTDRYYRHEMPPEERARVRKSEHERQDAAYKELRFPKDPASVMANKGYHSKGVEVQDQLEEGANKNPDFVRRAQNYRNVRDDVEGTSGEDKGPYQYKRGGKVKRYSSGGSVGGGSRGNGCAQRGKTKGRMC